MNIPMFEMSASNDKKYNSKKIQIIFFHPMLFALSTNPVANKYMNLAMFKIRIKGINPSSSFQRWPLSSLRISDSSYLSLHGPYISRAASGFENSWCRGLHNPQQPLFRSLNVIEEYKHNFRRNSTIKSLRNNSLISWL